MKKRMCKHFNGLQNRKSVCDKGHNYRDVTPGPDSGWYLRMPCREESENDCNDREFKSHEEIAEEKAEFDLSLKYSAKAIETIKEQTGVQPLWGDWNEDLKEFSGSIDCPKCGGHLSYVVAGGNHHIHGQCVKDGCLSFMM